MASPLPLEVLLAPVVIAVTTIATMLLATGAKGPRRVSAELGYAPDAATSLSMTAGRYVGGHPALAAAVARPMLLFTAQDLAVFLRRWGPMLFRIPWATVEQVSVLSRDEAEAAAASVRGLAPGAVEAGETDALYLRVRYTDERGWWQNVLFELAGPEARTMADEALAHWQRHEAGSLSA